jgi:uncharacterized protein
MRDPYEQLRRIQKAMEKIAEYTRAGRDSFEQEEKVRLSIMYYLQIIEHSVYSILQDFKDRHSEIPWEQMTDVQNRLGFYDTEMDRDALWEIATHDLPDLKVKIDAALEQKDLTDQHSKSVDAIIAEKRKAIALRELLQANRDAILRIAAKYGASNVRVFGSVARGEADAESDIDLLVDMEEDRSLLDLSRLLTNLQTLLGYKLDIVTEQGLNERLRERVLKEAVKL